MLSSSSSPLVSITLLNPLLGLFETMKQKPSSEHFAEISKGIIK